MVVRPDDSTPPLFLLSLALDSGTPCRNDEGGTSKLHHFEFNHYPLVFSFALEMKKMDIIYNSAEESLRFSALLGKINVV